MRRFKLACVAAMAITCAVPAPIPANAAMLTVGGASTFGGTSCADVRNGNLSLFVPLQVWACTGAGNQQYNFNGRAIHAMGEQRCLESASLTVGAAVISNACSGTAGQQWFYINGTVKLFQNTSLCLDGGSMANGASLTVQNCVNGKAAQFWQIK